MNDENSTPTRPLSVAHLVFGLIFGGIAAVWLIGEANGADYPDLAAGIPVVLIGAGIVGLVASLVNVRRAATRRTAAAEVGTETGADTTNTDETLVLDHGSDDR